MIILHRRGTTAEWRQADVLANTTPEVLLKNGEFAIEECEDGRRRVKIGDGHTKFSALPYIDERAELLLIKEIQTAKTDINSKLLELNLAQQKLATANIAIDKQIAELYTSLLDMCTTGDITTLDTAKQIIANEVANLKLLSTSSIAAINKELEATNKKLLDTKAQLGTAIYNTTNELTSNVNSAIKDVSITFDKKIEDLESAITENVEDSLTKHSKQNDDMFASILAKINALKENAKELKAADTALNTAIYGISNTTTAAINKLTTELAAFTTKYNTDQSAIQSELATQKEFASASYETLYASLLEYVDKIYVELADLVDDDILILEKAYSVENILTARMIALEKEFKNLVAQFNLLAPEALIETEARLTNKIDELNTILCENINNVHTELDNKITNIEEYFSDLDSIISDVTAAYKAADADILHNIETVANSTTEEITAAKQEFFGTVNAVKEELNSKINKVSVDFANADAELLNQINNVKQELTWAISGVDIAITDELAKTKANLTEELANLSASAAQNKSELEAKITDSNNRYNEALFELDTKLTANDTALAASIAEQTETFTAELDGITKVLSSDIAQAEERVNNKLSEINANYLRVNSDDNQLYVGDSIESVILYCGSASDI